MKVILLALVLVFMTLPAHAVVNKKGFPPQLGSEQVIFLYYALSGETPPYDAWVISDERSQEELKSLYETTADRMDLKQFHRELELALYNYNAESECQPMGAEKATFLSTPLLEGSKVELHVDNTENFACWDIDPESFAEVKARNNNVRYKILSVLEVSGVNQTEPRMPGNKVLNLHLKRMDVYTKDGGEHLVTIGENE